MRYDANRVKVKNNIQNYKKITGKSYKSIYDGLRKYAKSQFAKLETKYHIDVCNKLAKEKVSRSIF